MYVRFLSLFLVPALAAPFWQAKEKYHARVRNGEVLVSVHENQSGGARRLTLEGGAQVHATKDFVVSALRDYERLARLTGYAEEAHFDASSGILKVKLAAYGRRAQMDVKIQSVDDGVNVKVVEGALKGLAMGLHVTSIAAEICEVGVDGEFAYEKFPLPRFFVEFGMEVILKRMAWRLRHQVESDFKKKI
jgi:hypothetical protein